MILLLLVGTVLIGRLAWIQLVQGKWLKQKALEQSTLDIQVTPNRGTIFDRNGEELAVSASAGMVTAVPRSISDPEGVSAELAPLLGLKKEDILQKISNKKYQEVLLKRKVSNDIISEIRKLNLKGIEISSDTKRYYPNNNLAAHVLGFTGTDNQGLDGLEAMYDNILTGVPGRISTPKDASGRKIDDSTSEYYKPEDGYNLVLTIDEVIQHYVEKALDQAYADTKPSKGMSAIVMDPQTGEILAMANRPDYNPNDPFAGPKENWYNLWRNYAVSNVYEPGSVFKAITAAAALEEGVVTPDEVFYDHGYIMVAGQRINCWRYYNPHGRETFKEGVENSCNVVFVTVAQRLGKEKFYKYINAFGFGQKTGIRLPGESTGIVNPLEKIGPVELATISFGQGISVTPIQMITAFSAIANGGKLFQPYIVKAITDNNGNVVKKYEPVLVRQVISEETSREMRDILEGVVANGTGHSAYLEGYRVAGKTGTSEKYQQGKYIASFAAFAPADDPKVAVLVVIDEPNTFSHMGGAIAAPVVKSILSDTLRYLNVEPRYSENDSEYVQKDVTVPNLIGNNVNDAAKQLDELHLQYSIEGVGNKVVDQIPKEGEKIKEGSMVILYLDGKSEGNVRVPDLKGKTIREASDILSSYGLKINIKGDGYCVSQDPEAGTEVAPGTIVNLQFKLNDNS
ncbi:stage V sporulation protein D [Calorimonas adulescens]|uniref:stage V sporulation protein D n=1 Tax=Calorimonas adulescens TaxID=2606906 RepID=UPI0023AF06C7|nr:stage V sporulation protein D [Calorimonas adulescens]